MKPITLAGFAGAALATNARLLPEAVGVLARDARPGVGDLRPLNAALHVATVPSSPQRRSIWRMGRDVPNDANYWLSWQAPASVTRGFDGEDTTERTYFSGAGTPKWTNNVLGLGGGAPYPQAARELAVPAPTAAPIVTVNSAGTGTESTRFYVFTYVNDLGWESAPSPLSAGTLCAGGAQLTIANMQPPPAGAYGVVAKRVYRTQGGTGDSAEFLFLREIPVGTETSTDDARRLGDALSTTGWLPPPAGAFGLVALWSGMYALLSGKTVHVSAVGAPYAYPVANDIELVDTPVGTATWAQRLLVLTTGRPVLIEGQRPAELGDERLALSQPCVSAQSIVGFGHGAVWASGEGLAYAGEGGQILLTGPSAALPHGLLLPKQWKAMNPESMVAGRWGRFYVCSYLEGSTRRAFVIDPLAPAGGIWHLSAGFDACHYDERADELYVLVGGSVRKFDAGQPLTAVFRSKQFRQTFPVNYGHGQVVASGYPVTVRVFANGVLKRQKVVQSDASFRLPSGFTAADWQIEVESQFDVQVVRLATRPEHLKGA